MLPHSPPLPILATISVATGLITVTFDRRLRPQPTVEAQWSARANLTTGDKNRVFGVPGNALARDVTLATTVGMLDIGGPIVSYDAAVGDVVSEHDVPAPAFANYPLAVVP